MRFCLNQKIITNSTPTSGIEKVSGITEYEALRAEKLFRYEYSNQLNTSLLTFAFTVFTAGLIIFTLLFEFGGIFNHTLNENDNSNITIESTTDKSKSDDQTETEIKGNFNNEDETMNNNNNAKDQTYVVFVEYFFACFFLLPCFFSRINFRYTVKNSLRIGQLTDYIREKIQFDDDESWESFKRDYHVNYFYQKPSGVGGAKDIPQWINIISCGLSLAVGIVGVCTNNLLATDSTFLTICGFLLLLTIISFFIEKAVFVREFYKKHGITVFAGINLILDLVFIVLYTICGTLNGIINLQAIIIFLWLAIFQICILITPHYDKEIELANCVLEYTRAKLQYKMNKNNPDSTEARNLKIFTNFLKNSSVLQLNINRYTPKSFNNRFCKNEKQKIIIKCCNKCVPIFKQLETLDYDQGFFQEIDIAEALKNYLDERIADEK